ncbi:MAG: hypothetical protein ACR2GQ_03630 [Gemmatimonadota bacterium]
MRGIGSTLLALGALTVLTLAAPRETRAQDDPPPDSAGVAPDSAAAAAAAAAAEADSVAADSLVGELPGELVGALRDSTEEARFAVLADPLQPPDELVAARVISWDRARIRRSNALTLMELLAEMIPGSLTLRAGFVSGPHHLLDGPFGPGALELRVDGRPLPPLIGSQHDLSEFPIGTIDAIRVTRMASGWRVELTTVRRTDRRGYSRIEAASGDPNLESLRLVYTNGFGSNFAMNAGFELLDADSPSSDLQAFSGGVSWMPGGGNSGVELQYERVGFDRVVGEAATRKGARSRLMLGGRFELTDDLQASAWFGEAGREIDPDEAGLDPGSSDDAILAGAELRGVWPIGWASVGGTYGDEAWLPSFEAQLGGGVGIGSIVSLDASARIGSWDDFSTRDTRLGARIHLPISGLSARAEVATGIRGVPYAAGDSVRADSVGYDGLSAGLDLDAGPFRIGASVERQKVDRQFGFGTGFDDGGVIGPEADVVSLVGYADIPLLPLSFLGSEFGSIRVRGTARRNTVESATTPFYLPESMVRGEVYFEEDFLEDDLGVRIAMGIDRRDAWLVPDGLGGSVSSPSRTSFDFDLGIRIIGVQLFWRYDNVSRRLQQDLPGFEFPLRRQVFGIRWAFFD